MGPTERYTVLMGAEEQSIALDEAALLISAHLRPGVVVDEQLARIDELAAGVTGDSLDAIVGHLFVELGFSGNVTDYYDPANSCLDLVLDRRTGIPISLSVLLIAVGARLGRTMQGIGMPGHFLVRDVTSGSYIDAFGGGTILDPSGCRTLFERLSGDHHSFDGAWLEPVGARAIIRRMLNNLVSIASLRHDRPSLMTAMRLRAILPDATVAERAEFADVLATNGEVTRAACVLEAIAVDAPPAEAESLRRAATRLRAGLN